MEKHPFNPLAGTSIKTAKQLGPHQGVLMFVALGIYFEEFPRKCAQPMAQLIHGPQQHGEIFLSGRRLFTTHVFFLFCRGDLYHDISETFVEVEIG